MLPMIKHRCIHKNSCSTIFCSSCLVLFSNDMYNDECSPTNVIKTCSPSYNNSDVRDKCEKGSFAVIVHPGFPSVFYKNIDCAFCNGIGVDEDLNCMTLPG